MLPPATLPSISHIPFPHRVVPFLADFQKDVIKPVDLLDGLIGIRVQSNQYKLLDCWRTERRKNKNRKERKRKNEGRKGKSQACLSYIGLHDIEGVSLISSPSSPPGVSELGEVFCPLTSFLAFELNGERLSDEGLFLLVLMLSRHIDRVCPVWRGGSEEGQVFWWISQQQQRDKTAGYLIIHLLKCLKVISKHVSALTWPAQI